MLMNQLSVSSTLLTKAKVLSRESAGRGSEDPILMSRRKFIEAIHEQQMILESDEKGEAYCSDIKRTHIDKNTGETFERSKRIRKWFWKSGDNYNLSLYYGNKVAIDQVFQFTNAQDLHDFLNGIAGEARKGVLDAVFKQFKGSKGGARKDIKGK